MRMRQRFTGMKWSAAASVGLLVTVVCVVTLLQPACGGGDGGSPTSPPPPGNARVTFDSTGCSCVSGKIRLYIDDQKVGEMVCMKEKSFDIAPGNHSADACDSNECWGRRTVYCAPGSQTMVTRGCTLF